MFNRYALMICGALACAALARADCIDGMRPATDAEKSFHVSTMNALKAALPAAPAGWVLSDDTRIAPPTSMCTGQEKSPIILSYRVRYRWTEGEKARRARSEENRLAVQALRALPPDQQKESDDLAKRSRNLDRQAAKARAAGNQAEYDRLKKEAAELAKQSNAIVDAHMKSVREKINALSKDFMAREKDLKTEVRVDVGINLTQVPFVGETRAAPYAGAPVGMRTDEKMALCFGPWKVATRTAGKSKYTDLTAQVKPGAPATSVQTVLVRLDGTPKQVDEIAAGFNAGALSGLLSR